MDHEPVPDYAKTLHPAASERRIGPPPGVSRNDCGDAFVLVDSDSADDGMGYTFRAYFRPSADEIAMLARGGHVEFFVRGMALVPFGANIVPAGSPEAGEGVNG